jgi:hypothetical protein
MAAPRTQTYANHQHRPIAWNITWLASVVVLVAFAWNAYRAPSALAGWFVVLAAVVVMAVSLLRTFALTLQNRIIRLEMQVRLARLGRERDMARLTLPQLIALRFASDAELPALVDRTITEQLAPAQIKRAVTDWQGDFLRT